MSQVLIEEDSLTAIGDAIRTKTGSSEKLSVPTGMVEAIEGISSGESSITYNEIDSTILTRYTDSYTMGSSSSVLQATTSIKIRPGFKFGLLTVMAYLTSIPNSTSVSASTLKGSHTSFLILPYQKSQWKTKSSSARFFQTLGCPPSQTQTYSPAIYQSYLSSSADLRTNGEVTQDAYLNFSFTTPGGTSTAYLMKSSVTNNVTFIQYCEEA